MPDLHLFEYAVVRVVPRVEREEFLNAGVILLCRAQRYLGARTLLDARRLAALAPQLDTGEVQEHLDLIGRICAGGAQAGPFAELSQVERFRWLTAVRSTVVQASPVHSGLCEDARQALEGLLQQSVGAAETT